MHAEKQGSLTAQVELTAMGQGRRHRHRSPPVRNPERGCPDSHLILMSFLSDASQLEEQIETVGSAVWKPLHLFLEAL